MFGSPAKMAEPIKMPLGMWTRLGPRNRVLDWGPGMSDDTAMSCAKVAEPIEITFGVWTPVGPRKYEMGVHISMCTPIKNNKTIIKYPQENKYRRDGLKISYQSVALSQTKSKLT